MKVKAGLLPLYIALYDKSSPEMRPVVEKFYADIADKLEAQGISVVRNPVCCIEPEVKEAIGKFEAEKVDAIITLHLAYHPSLESEKELAATKLPIVVLDTTPDYLFDHTIDSAAISYNHGIHGVQDMCCLLVKNGKPFEIFAGHYEKSDVIERAAKAVKAIGCANALCNTRVGKVGGDFKGMGDFAITEKRLKKDFGIDVVKYDGKKGAEYCASVTADEIEAEHDFDLALATGVEDIDRELYDFTERVALGIRKWLNAENLAAFTINFSDAGSEGLATMPFSEPCKAMARGIGYAGEGDLLTAALVGAILKGFDDATFAEMFCPDWQHDTVFFSHMGEYNLKCAACKPHMIKKFFPYADSPDPTSILSHMKPGKVCFADLAPRKDGYDFITCDGDMIELPEKVGSFEDSVSGWFKPHLPLPEFLEKYSRAGGTHHGMLIYGADSQILSLFASQLGFNHVTV